MARNMKKLGMLVFLNGQLCKEGKDNDYELVHSTIDEDGFLVPRFNFNLKGSGSNPDSVTVIDPVAMTRCDYTVRLRPVLVCSTHTATYPGKAG